MFIDEVEDTLDFKSSVDESEFEDFYFDIIDENNEMFVGEELQNKKPGVFYLKLSEHLLNIGVALKIKLCRLQSAQSRYRHTKSLSLMYL